MRSMVEGAAPSVAFGATSPAERGRIDIDLFHYCRRSLV